MTTDQKKTLADFETLVRQLMYKFDRLKQENTELRNQLLATSQSYESALNEIKSLNVKYDNLKIARIIAVKQDDLQGAKRRLSKLVREVDKCIALLNE